MTAIFSANSRRTPEAMIVFAFIWACQTLVHQDFFPEWLVQGSLFGWMVTVLAVATLLYPKSLALFSSLLVCSVAYNFGRWPWVSNHMLLVVLVELAILSAIASAVYSAWRRGDAVDSRLRQQIYARFAPLLRAMLVALYYIIFLSKLNWDFVDLDTSCLTGMYQDVVDRFAPLPIPTAEWALELALWAFLAIEIVLPVLLMFERTRYAGILIGLPFHLILGLVGHRTFSAFVYGMYAVFCMGPVTALLADLGARIRRDALARIVKLARGIVPAAGAAAVLIYFSGDFTEPSGVLSIFAYGPEMWLFWACSLGLLYAGAILKDYRSQQPRRLLPVSSPKPGWLWVFLGITIINGLSPYVGLKTQTSFSMYSNLRTGAGVNNHMFMPALRLAGYQDDFVEIVATDHSEIANRAHGIALGDQAEERRKKLVAYFELRRLVSETTKQHFYVDYIRNGERHSYVRRGAIGANDELAREHPYLLGKLLRFRGIFADEQVHCQH